METKTETPAEDAGVIARLKKHKADNSGLDDTTLPETGIKVTWPKFQPHDLWMRAQGIAKNKVFSTVDIYIVLLCKFDDEKITIEEFKSLIPNGDALHLIGEVMGGDDEEGNATA